MIKESSDPTAAGDERVHEPGIVSVNSRGGTSGQSVARGVFLLIVGAIIITGVLMGINAWNASRKAEAAKDEQAAKQENKPAQIGPRRVFDTDPPRVSSTTGNLSAPKKPAVIVPGVELTPDEVARPIPLMGQSRGPRPATAALPSRFSGDALLPSSVNGIANPPISHKTSDSQAAVSLVRDLMSASRQTGTSEASLPIVQTPDTSSAPSDIGTPLPAPASNEGRPNVVLPTGVSSLGLAPPPGPAASGAGPIGGLLSPSNTPSVHAERLGDRNMMLPKGRSIDCALTVRVVNEVSGMATCLLTSDVYSDNGRVVLLDRGSEAVGEYTATMAQGQRRLFLLWSRVKTPIGVVIQLNSPAADELGTAGLAGEVDNHWVDRLGAAFLLSIVQDAIGFATAAAAGGGGQGQLSIFQNSAATGNRMAEYVLQSTINIKPTLYKNQGDRATIFVARDLDFGSVYALRPN